MAHGPLHPPVSPTNQALLLGKLSDILPARRQFHEKFVSQARYEHFSALRSTDEPCAPPENTPPCCSMEVAIPSSCEDCVQECEEGVCDVELTEQCTDQCVVVPCNVAHHGYTPRDPPDDIHAGFTPCEVASAAGCDLICTDGPDCDALDTIMRCCPEYHHLFPETRNNASSSQSHFQWPSLTDQFLHGYGAHVASHHGSFYAADSSASTPQLVTNSLAPTPHSAMSPVSSMSSPMSMSHDHSLHHPHASPGLVCMWGNCGATFATMNELVGHVNLQHLRLPAASAPPARTDPSALSCLWADCQVYPTPSSVPGPSAGNAADNALGVLASHLLQDHLGLPTPTDAAPRRAGAGTAGDPARRSAESDATSVSPPVSCPPTPAPEHDCDAPAAHVCRWTGCGESFASCDALTAHINSNHVGSGKAHYDCYWEGCSRHGDNGFASKQKICRHLQSHTGHRPFQCKICAQNFSEAATLAQHMRRHTQEKPYVCDYPGCGKSFAITGALTIHKRTHNGHKPFKCTFCDRCFTESSNLSKHLRTHTGIRPYPCTEPGCSKTFARPDQLARHMSVHRKKDPKAEAAAPA